MGTKARALAAGLAAVALIVTAGCAKDETAETSPATTSTGAPATTSTQVDPTELGTGRPSGPGSSGSGSGTFDDVGDSEAPPIVLGLQNQLRVRFVAEAWYQDVFGDNSSWGFGGTGDEVRWTVVLGSDPDDHGATDADLIEVCDAMAAYLDDVEVVNNVEISIEARSGGAAVVTRAPGERCEAA